MHARMIASLIFFAGGALFIATGAGATPVQVQFSGALTTVDADLSSRLAVGQQFTGTYTYEPSTPGPFSTPNTGVYLDAISAMTVTFPDYIASGPVGGGIFIENDQPVGADFRDAYSISLNIGGDSIGIFNLNQVNLILSTLQATPPTVLDTIALTQPLPSPSLFDTQLFWLVFFNDEFTEQRNVMGTITGLTAISIPEPETLLLVGLGLAGIGLSHRCKRAN